MTTSFHGLDLLTAPGRVFTPRPATEALVDAALARVDGRPVTVADVGTGTGAIAVAIAVAAPQAEVWATDTSEDAVELARANAKRHVVRGNLLEPVPDAVDVVVANLPYLPDDERRPEYDAEPEEAIYAPGDGLGPLRALVALCADGKLAMPGFVLVQYHRDVLEADCQHLPELREELDSRAPARA